MRGFDLHSAGILPAFLFPAASVNFFIAARRVP
jgi:hypothetical protein